MSETNKLINKYLESYLLPEEFDTLIQNLYIQYNLKPSFLETVLNIIKKMDRENLLKVKDNINELLNNDEITKNIIAKNSSEEIDTIHNFSKQGNDDGEIDISKEENKIIQDISGEINDILNPQQNDEQLLQEKIEYNSDNPKIDSVINEEQKSVEELQIPEILEIKKRERDDETSEEPDSKEQKMNQ